jgi:hypothetical protein
LIQESLGRHQQSNTFGQNHAFDESAHRLLALEEPSLCHENEALAEPSSV